MYLYVNPNAQPDLPLISNKLNSVDTKEREQGTDKESEQDITLRIFCAVNGFTVESIKGRRRHEDLVGVRQVFCKWATENTNMSLAEIGNMIERDHATVLYSARTANDRIDVKDKVIMPIFTKCYNTLRYDKSI